MFHLFSIAKFGIASATELHYTYFNIVFFCGNGYSAGRRVVYLRFSIKY